MAERLIDAKALLSDSDISEFPVKENEHWVPKYFVKVDDIKEAPTIDAVEVVRCKNCKYKDTEDCPMSECADENYTWKTDSKAKFCSYGERK